MSPFTLLTSAAKQRRDPKDDEKRPEASLKDEEKRPEASLKDEEKRPEASLTNPQTQKGRLSPVTVGCD